MSILDLNFLNDCVKFMHSLFFLFFFCLISSYLRTRSFISRNTTIIIDAEQKNLRNARWYENSRPRAFSLFIPFSTFFLSCLPVWFTARFAATVSSFFFLDCSFTTDSVYGGTLTRTLGRRVIRRGTCWRKQSPRVNTESDERVIVNWENRVISLVISIASDCRYLLSRRYSRGQPICFRHPTFNFAKDNHRPYVYNSRALYICIEL